MAVIPWIFQMVARYDQWRHRRQSLRQLQEMDSRSLKDMGITRQTIEREAAKSFWRS
ncbi:DUF1127 domain-containing protein [Magnetospira sp. QH-2]|uniref:DUF1127 domain-containing protein n=1 Tax=Magnetospira sp. (strain QH-2) TaxID=1288970 RepID=UPI0009E54450|nr:DUF1127 domain-containing protein [Magnetospira sp. QH-2]